MLLAMVVVAGVVQTHLMLAGLAVVEAVVQLNI
jgi:hypothetical protein